MSRVAVVTGGAGAIGGAIAARLAAADHTVAILDRVAEFPVDLGDAGAVRATAAQVLETHGRCDVLVHAAAAFDRASLQELDAAAWRRVQAVNVESALWLSQAFAPGMTERGFGRIVFVVSDTVWEPPAPDLLAYVASKAALIGVGRTLARALGRDGITVNCVAPGLTPTPTAVADTPPEAF
ncbi:MAG TPA: SDR family oxidoreductase, partial [Solirubrobacteraceae bacterium]|nr:SDR family oxidoreductase [Solirubrobacteraceae bacterium]